MRVVESSDVLFREAGGWVVDLSHSRQLAENLDSLHHL